MMVVNVEIWDGNRSTRVAQLQVINRHPFPVHPDTRVGRPGVFSYDARIMWDARPEDPEWTNIGYHNRADGAMALVKQALAVLL